MKKMSKNNSSPTKLLLIFLSIFTIVGSGWAYIQYSATTANETKKLTISNVQEVDLPFSSEFVVDKIEKNDGYLILKGKFRGKLIANTDPEERPSPIMLNLQDGAKSNKGFPLNDCMLLGKAWGDIANDDRTIIRLDYLTCANKQNATEIQGAIYDIDENMGLKGKVLGKKYECIIKLKLEHLEKSGLT